MGAEIHGGHENNEEYFNRVYNETCRSVSRFVVSKCGNREDAEDIIQNVYTRFFKRISEKGHEDIESPEAFLINIAKFECRTYFSGRKKDDKVTSFPTIPKKKWSLSSGRCPSLSKDLRTLSATRSLQNRFSMT